MNWSKAKTILIIAFLVTNALLAIVLYSEGNQEVSTTKESFIEDVIDILEKKDISLNTDIPDEMPSLNTLTVRYEMLDRFDVNKRFFDGKGDIEKINDDKFTISKDDETVTIENNKKLKYKNLRKSNGYDDLDKDRAKEMVNSFLEKRGYDTTEMMLWRLELDENLNMYRMKYSKIYDERYLETAYTNVLLDREGVIELERLWLVPVSEGETPIYINTAPKALLDLIGNEKVYGKTISDISLCYYFDPKKDQYIEEPEETKEGKSIPAWRIIFEDGTKTIIDNY